MGVVYLIGDATDVRDGFGLILHIVNTLGSWGKGFVVPLGKRYPLAKKVYQESSKELGTVSFALCPNPPYGTVAVANLVAQEGMGSKKNPPIRYPALRKALERLVSVMDCAGLKKAYLPRMGCGLAGGKWELVEAELLRYPQVTWNVFDLP